MRSDLGQTPKYQIWADRIRKQIQSGELKPGERLPSFSQMKQSGFSQATLDRALALLESEGLIVRREKIGVFIADEAGSAREVAAAVASVSTPRSPSTDDRMSEASVKATEETARQGGENPATIREHPSGLVGIPGMAFASRNHFHYEALFLGGVLNALRSGEKQIVLLDNDSPIGWGSVDGVIMLNESAVSRFLPAGVPWVYCLNAVSNTPSFMPDEESGATLLARHLIELGHRRIACLMELPNPLRRSRVNDPVGLRIDGWQKVLSENGIARNPKWRRNLYAPLDPLPNYRRSAYHVMHRWLQEDWFELGCTAIMTQNDMAAIGAIEALHEAGLKVPEDVSITGFDGVESSPPRIPEITSARVPLAEIGTDAAKTLLRMMQGEVIEPSINVYPVELLRRGTTAPPARR